MPTLSVEMENDALPPLRAAAPSTVEPSRNWTVPVAVEDETVAVNVTALPLFDGLGLDVNVVVVLAVFTVWDSAEDELPP